MFVRQGAKVRAELVRATGPCVQLTRAAGAAARRLQRIFFLHEGHDLSRFLARPHTARSCHALGTVVQARDLVALLCCGHTCGVDVHSLVVSLPKAGPYRSSA